MKTGKPKKKKNPATALECWRLQRNITQEDLAQKAGLTRQIVCDACNYGPLESHLPALASALHVGTADIGPDREPSEAARQCGAFSKTVGIIMDQLNTLPPQPLAKKADAVISLLAMEDFTPAYQTALRCILATCNGVALSYAAHHISSAFPAPHSAGPLPSPAPCSCNRLDQYMKLRDINVNELADRTGLSRQTISLAKKDPAKLRGMKKENIEKIAAKLTVQVADLIPDGENFPVIDVRKILKAIREAADRCLPGQLEEKAAFISLCIEAASPYKDLLVNDLLQTSDAPKAESLLRFLPSVAEFSFFQKDHEQEIQIGYYLTEDKSAYMAFVLFEPWVYKMFGLTAPFSDSQELLSYLPDFPLAIPAGGQDPDYDPEPDIFDQVDDYLWTDELNSIPDFDLCLKNVFADFLEENLPRASMCRYEFEDIEQELPARLYMREQQYRELASKVMAPASLTQRQLTALAKVFSRLREDPASENRILSMYGVSNFYC